ncbi:hypothetical protein ACFOUV_09350 [Oceanobacillus longus]|uniref:DUF4358 domain-containing protein n=1 Tax=Oceanobacillus longus TaxID=930120 RepID=A0ABV8GWD5_9BACI
MKRFIAIAILTFILFLSGCMNPAVVSVVQDVYEAALVENDVLVETYFSEDYLADHSLEKLSAEMREDVRNREGIKLMNMKEHKERQLTPEVVEMLNEEYDKDWNFVTVQTSDDRMMIWIVVRGEQRYYIIDGKKMDTETFLEDILK